MKNKIQPDGIIITISAGMLKEKGYKNWLYNFMLAMDQHEGPNPWVYWMRLGSQPKKDILYVYLCIGGKVRFRCFYAGARSASEKTFGELDGSQKTIRAKAWCLLSGPIVRPTIPIPMKGFRGFRYCERLF